MASNNESIPSSDGEKKSIGVYTAAKVQPEWQALLKTFDESCELEMAVDTVEYDFLKLPTIMYLRFIEKSFSLIEFWRRIKAIISKLYKSKAFPGYVDQAFASIREVRRNSAEERGYWSNRELPTEALQHPVVKRYVAETWGDVLFTYLQSHSKKKLISDREVEELVSLFDLILNEEISLGRYSFIWWLLDLFSLREPSEAELLELVDVKLVTNAVKAIHDEVQFLLKFKNQVLNILLQEEHQLNELVTNLLFKVNKVEFENDDGQVITDVLVKRLSHLFIMMEENHDEGFSLPELVSTLYYFDQMAAWDDEGDALYDLSQAILQKIKNESQVFGSVLIKADEYNQVISPLIDQAVADNLELEMPTEPLAYWEEFFAAFVKRKIKRKTLQLDLYEVVDHSFSFVNLGVAEASVEVLPNKKELVVNLIVYPNGDNFENSLPMARLSTRLTISGDELLVTGEVIDPENLSEDSKYLLQIIITKLSYHSQLNFVETDGSSSPTKPADPLSIKPRSPKKPIQRKPRPNKGKPWQEKATKSRGSSPVPIAVNTAELPRVFDLTANLVLPAHFFIDESIMADLDEVTKKYIREYNEATDKGRYLGKVTQLRKTESEVVWRIKIKRNLPRVLAVSLGSAGSLIFDSEKRDKAYRSLPDIEKAATAARELWQSREEK